MTETTKARTKSVAAAPPARARTEGRPAAQGPAADISALQRLAGNQAVSGLLAEADPQRPVPPGSMEAAVLTRVTAVGARSGPASTVQRQGPDAPPAAAGGVTASLGSLTASTFPELMTVERCLSSQLSDDAKQLADGEPARKAAEDLVGQARSLEPFLQSKGNAPLDQAAADQAGLWYQEFVTASKNVDAAGKAAARAQLERQQQQMDDALSSVQGIPDDMADLQRAAFLKKDEATLEKIQGAIGKSLIAASALLDARSKINFMMTKLTEEPTHLQELIEHYER